MHTPPFHRRILPWIFAVAFLAMAPSVIFFTAGYRWNPKKNMIERYGTVIVDTTPSQSDISIDGRPLTEQTPHTIQNMAPGLHQFSLSKNGYSVWTKNLDVFPEQVTFVSDIWLWKRSMAIERLSTSSTIISSAPDDRTLLILSASSPTQMIIYNTITGQTTSSSISGIIERSDHISWSDSSRYALVESSDGTWILDATNVQKPVQLPESTYRWSGNDLIGSRNHVQTRIRLRDMSITRESLPPSTIDLSDVAELRTAQNGHDVIFVSRNTPQTGFVLPSGNWSFWSEQQSTTILRDADRWLSLQEKLSPPTYHIAIGDHPRPFTVKRLTKYLLINENELWLWDPVLEPELLIRQSNKIIGAQWHHEGADIFIATENNIFVLNLDTRDGRIKTELASFDHITSFAVVGKSIFVGGSTSSRTGVWELGVE